jgi:aspartyl-tRNA(Asn)/glutamyl-tRNA(Gln) amidotransferase subunit C
MAKLTKDEIEHVAKLSKLNLTEGEIEKFLPQLSNVIDYVSELSEVDTSKMEPTSQTTGLTDVYRQDEGKPEGSLTQDEALSGTEETHNGYFKVGAILTERTDK